MKKFISTLVKIKILEDGDTTHLRKSFQISLIQELKELTQEYMIKLEM